MSTTWKKVSYNVRAEDQAQRTIADDGTITDQVIATYTAETDHTSYGTATESLSATDGTTSVPVVGGSLSVAGEVLPVTQSLARRTGPYSFDVQVTAVAKYYPNRTGKWNVKVVTSGVKTTQDAYYDKDGKAIQSSAGESFDPTLPVTFNDEQIVVSYTTDSDESEALDGIRGLVNSIAVNFSAAGVSRSFDERCLRCEDAGQSSGQTQQNGSPTFNVTATFLNRKSTFDVKVPDKGYYFKNSSGQLQRIMDGSSPPKPIAVPAYLDGSGNVLPPGSANSFQLTFHMDTQGDLSIFFQGLS